MEDDPIRMFVMTRYRAALLALITTFFAAGAAQAQKAPVNARASESPANFRASMVPLRNYPMLGNATNIPKDIPVRSLNGVKGFEKQSSRVRIGGDNGASVTEKVVNVTRTDVLDERTPVWSSDERYFFFSGNTLAKPTRYNLYRIATDEPTDASSSTAVPLTDNTATQYDYYFPSINVNVSRLAFVRSSDGLEVDNPTKRWDLYVSDLPASGQYINTAELGATNLRSLTLRPDGTPRRFPDDSPASTDPRITNVGRPAWIGSSDVVFAAQLEGESNYHLFTVNIETKIVFQLTAGQGDERNPQVSPDGRYIAFDSNAAPSVTDAGAALADTVYKNVGTRVRSATDRDATPASAKAIGATRNIFTCSTLGQNVRQFTLQYSDAPVTTVNNVQPTWSYASNSNFFNPEGDTFRLAWSSDRVPVFDASDTEQTGAVIGWKQGPADKSGIYYAVITRNRGNSLLFEANPIDLNNVDADGARQLDTANDTLVKGVRNDPTLPRYRDQYPAIGPFVTAFRIGFQSNRNGNYNTNGFGSGFSAPTGPTQNNLFIASTIDITAPTLIRFTTNTPVDEVVHINLVTNPTNPFDAGTSVRNRSDGITPGSTLHFAVRVEDRGAGLRPENSPDGGAVYLQIKNPNSRYQTLQQTGGLVGDVTRGEYKEFTRFTAFLGIVSNNAVSYGNRTTGYNVGQEYECQAISAAGASNTFPTDAAKGTQYYSHSDNSLGIGPLYQAGDDDIAAFSGNSHPPLDGKNGTQNVWLQLKPLLERNADGSPKKDANGNTIPLRPSDGRGGVLYGSTWTIPTQASDWYLDVIVYDNAVNPFDPTQRSNFIIYDNVWGFSSAPPISGQATDILFVSDYTLGQKFFTSRFGSKPLTSAPNNNRNRIPFFFGAESYFTDVDLQRYPSEQGPAVVAYPDSPTATTFPVYSTISPFRVTVAQPGGGAYGRETVAGMPNVLGVEGYGDEYTSSGAVTIEPSLTGRGDYRLFPTSRYSFWRTLSRGPVPTSLLQDYLPTITTAPADVAKGEKNPRTIISATRMVVWASPFSGNLFVGPGHITDVNTQNSLTNFVASGGRLFISGQDLGFALAGSGQANTFFTNTLKAKFASDTDGGFNQINAGAGADRISRDVFARNSAYGYFVPNTGWVYSGFNSGTPTPTRYVNGGPDAGVILDASYSGFASYPNNNDVITAAPDTGTVTNSLATLTRSSNAAALIVSASVPGINPLEYDPAYNPNKAFQPVGKVAFSPQGFESISQSWYTYAVGSTTFRATVGRRTILMNNIVDWFRTGALTGRVIDNDGKPVSGALIRAIRDVADDTQVASGTAISDDTGNFQIIGLQPGFYVLYGYQAGFYTQHNTGNSVRGGWRSATNLVLKKAGPGSLSGIKGANNTSGGVLREDGTPVPDGVEVMIVRQDSNGKLSNDVRTSSTGTDGSGLPQGAYNFESILIGTYMIVANSTYTVINGEWVPKPRNPDGSRTGVNEKYLTDVVVGFSGPPAADTKNYWAVGPGTVVVDAPGLPKPKGVVISEGQTAQINFLLPSSPKRIKGHIIDQDAKTPIAGAIITATQADGTLVASGTSDADGNYTLTRPNAAAGEDAGQIRGGVYTITATANGFDSRVPPDTTSEVNGVKVDTTATADVTVTVPELRLKKLPPGSLSGLVTRVVGSNNPTTTGVAGAVVTLYAVVTVDGNQVQAATPSYTVTVVEPPTTTSGYTYNFKIDSVLPGTYNAYVAKPGLTGNPSPFSNITVTSGTETRNVNLRLEPPKTYLAGIQLISVPQDFSGQKASSVFGITANGDNNGDGVTDASDASIYNAFNVAEWNGADYNISKDIPLRLGKGYFVKFPIQVAVNALGTALTTNSFTIDLLGGWNLIGHPFSSQVNASDPAAAINLSSDLVSLSYTAPNGTQRTNVSYAQAVLDNAVQNTAFRYTGSGSGNQYQQANVLTPWNGYWLRAFVPVQLTLRYPGPGSRAAKPSRATNGKYVTVTRAMMDQIVPRNIESKGLTDWRLQIAARQGDLTDTDNSIGVAPDAHDSFDNRYDSEKPPIVPDASGLYLTINGVNAASRSVGMSDDIRSPGGTKSWTFTVQANRSGEVTVYWPNIGRLPRGIEPTMVDEATGKRVAMRGGSSSFRFTPNGRAERRFRIEVAPAASLPLDILNLRSLPGSSRSAGYRFTFTTTRAVDVSAEIRTLTGKAVRRVNTRAAAGAETSVVWDGRDENGGTLPPGAYMVRITVLDENGASASRSVPVQTLQ